jgi:hypothetical protein
MTERGRFRICYQLVTSNGALVYFRLHEQRADGTWYDASPYGPLSLETENFHEFISLLELGARRASSKIQYIEWEPFQNAKLPNSPRATLAPSEAGNNSTPSNNGKEANNI